VDGDKMKLRIIVGNTEKLREGQPDHLDSVFKSKDLEIQAGQGIEVLELEDGRKAFFGGMLAGIRTSNNSIAPCNQESAKFKKLICEETMEGRMQAMEGRFLLTVVEPEGQCRICSDRFGRMDLYYQCLDDGAIIASDLSLLPVSKGTVEYDQASLAYVLTVYGYRPPKKHTLYRDVKRIGVGEWIEIENGIFEIRKNTFQPTVTEKYGEQNINKYADILLDAVQICGSDKGNVVSLSSGWDSTSLLACLVHLFGKDNVRAFVGRQLYSIRYDALNQFEVERAQKIADYFGVHLDVVDLDYRKAGPHLVQKHREMLKSHSICSHSGINQATVYDFVNKTGNGDETVFVGEISDGAHNLGFSQYTTIFHPTLSFREYSDKMMSYLFGPTFLASFQNGSFEKDPVFEFLRDRKAQEVFDPLSDEGPNDRVKQLLASFFLRSNRFPLWSLANSKILTEKGIQLYSREMEQEYLQGPSEALTPNTLYSWYLHLYNSFHWQSSLVASRYLMADAYGINLAMPFWDSRIQDWLSAMPEEWGRGLDFNPTKYPLKWMLKNRIDYPLHLQVGPHSYLYDVDPSFSHAAEILYHSQFSSYFRDRLISRKYRDILSPDIFDLDYIDSAVGRYLDGTQVEGSEREDLFNLCMLHSVGWYGD